MLTLRRRRSLRPHAVALGLAALLVGACSPELGPILGCEPREDIRPICGLQNPEDLALLADGRTLVVSQYGLMDGSRAGSLALLDVGSGEHRVAWEGGSGATSPADDWAAPDCPGPPDETFSPHGIDLFEAPGGRTGLWVVNHGGRESVEVFEVRGRGLSAELLWRGCVVAPMPLYLNDVVALPEGGFLATHMMARDGETWGIVRSALGRDTGAVYQWQPGRGFEEVFGTAGPLPNGIELSADGTEIYLNLYMAGEVRRIRRENGERLATAQVRQPDNSTWARDGRLLVASHLGGLGDSLQCQALTEGSCPMAYEIVALDPESLEGETIHSGAGAPMGAATVALDVGDLYVLGSYSGDRVILVPKGPRPAATTD